MSFEMFIERLKSESPHVYGAEKIKITTKSLVAQLRRAYEAGEFAGEKNEKERLKFDGLFDSFLGKKQ